MINVKNLEKDLKNILGENWEVDIFQEPFKQGFNIQIFSTINIDSPLAEDLYPAINKVRQNIFSLKPVMESTSYFNKEIDRLEKEVAELQKYKIYFELEKELRTK